MFENIKRVLNEYGKLLVETYRDKLTDKDVNASNALFNSVKYIVETDAVTFEVKLSLEEHWKYVEKGRKAGKFPPINKIEKWIEIKPVIPRPMANGKLPTTQQLAYLISRKIYLYGIEPRPLLEQSIDEVYNRIRDDLEKALIQDIQSEFEIIKGMWF